ncbi:MAG: SIR2 family NAD-dependent protein deacylase [Actinomycetota bacterium]
MAIHGISSEQETALEQAQTGSPFRIVRSLWELIETGELLDPRWREIWAKHRSQAVRNEAAPSEVIESIDEAISRIESVDRAIDQLVFGDNDGICLLLGAGASAPAPSSIPTVNRLLPELWRRGRKLGRDDIDRLAEWCDQRKVTNIEDLLTAAYLANFAAKSGTISGLLNYFLFREADVETPMTLRGRAVPSASQVEAASVALFQETLQGLFGLLTGTMIPAPPNDGHSAVVDFIRRHPKATVITTNYDGCIDEALLTQGVSYSTNLDEGKTLPGSIDLIKIHGSINWTYCDSCHDVREFDLLKLKEGYAEDTISYAVVGICRNCGGQRRPLLIPPMGLKFVMFPNLIRLWNLARERIESASHLLIVGFSFSEADSYINKVIERSMSFNAKQVMIVFDPDGALVPSLRRRFSARIEGFDSDRILAAVGSAHELLPKILGSLGLASQGPPHELSG